MIKRTMANGGAMLQDPSAPQDHYVTVSKAPNTDTTKVVWHVDPSALVGPREEEARRKAPEGKILYAVSAVLTIIVLWGVFRHAHFLVPRMFSSTGPTSLEESVSAYQTDRVDSSAADLDLGRKEGGKRLLEFDFDASGIVGDGRRTAKQLLEIPRVQRYGERVRVGHNLHKVWDKQQKRADAKRPVVHGIVH